MGSPRGAGLQPVWRRRPACLTGPPRARPVPCESRPSSIASGPRALSRAGSPLHVREHGLRPSPNQDGATIRSIPAGSPSHSDEYPAISKIPGRFLQAQRSSGVHLRGVGDRHRHGRSVADGRQAAEHRRQVPAQARRRRARGLGDLRSGVVEDERHQEVGRRRVRPGLHRRDEIRRRVARKRCRAPEGRRGRRP